MVTETNDQRIAFRVPSSGVKRLEMLAREASCSTAEVLRRLIDQAEVLHEPQIIVRRR